MSRMVQQQRAREARLAEYDQRVEAAIAQGHRLPAAIEAVTRLAPRTVDLALTRLKHARRIRFSILQTGQNGAVVGWVRVAR